MLLSGNLKLQTSNFKLTRHRLKHVVLGDDVNFLTLIANEYSFIVFIQKRRENIQCTVGCDELHGFVHDFANLFALQLRILDDFFQQA